MLSWIFMVSRFEHGPTARSFSIPSLLCAKGGKLYATGKERKIGNQGEAEGRGRIVLKVRAIADDGLRESDQICVDSVFSLKIAGYPAALNRSRACLPSQARIQYARTKESAVTTNSKRRKYCVSQIRIFAYQEIFPT